VNERFLYEYDFTDGWEHQVRMERFIPQAPLYPKCIAGSRAAPPEDCGGPIAFQERRDAAPWEARDLLRQIADCVDKRDLTALRDRIDEIGAVKEWLLTDRCQGRSKRFPPRRRRCPLLIDHRSDPRPGFQRRPDTA
jgi:hypothetical protein